MNKVPLANTNNVDDINTSIIALTKAVETLERLVKAQADKITELEKKVKE